jgi:hypothetical protein
MPSVPPSSERFWLLTGEVPSGPFTVDQVHAKIASGDATWQTPACAVGGSNWLPVVRTPGLGPVAAEAKPPAGEGAESAAPKPLPAPPEPATAPQNVGRTSPPPLPFTPSPPSVPAASSEPAPAPTPANTKSEHIGAAIGVVVVLLLIAGIVYGSSWVWAQIRSPSATEVCKKIDEAKTAAEAKKYATPRMYPLLDAMFADKNALDPNDTSEWTQEVDGPRPDTKLVGFKGTTFVPEAGRRVRVEGHFVVVKSDGWKVDDAVLTGVEGAALPGPVSLVDEHRASLTQPKAPTPGTATVPPGKNRPPGAGTSFRPTVLDKPAWERHPVGKVVASVRDAIGWGGIVALLVLIAVGAAVRESWRKKSPTA